jgi:hypothetical protein
MPRRDPPEKRQDGVSLMPPFMAMQSTHVGRSRMSAVTSADRSDIGGFVSVERWCPNVGTARNIKARRCGEVGVFTSPA